jgi:transposase
MKQKYIRYSGNEEVAIHKRHLVDKVSVSDLCDEYQLNPTVFYRWQKDFFEKSSLKMERIRQKHVLRERIIAHQPIQNLRMQELTGQCRQ